MIQQHVLASFLCIRTSCIWVNQPFLTEATIIFHTNTNTYKIRGELHSKRPAIQVEKKFKPIYIILPDKHFLDPSQASDIPSSPQLARQFQCLLYLQGRQQTRRRSLQAARASHPRVVWQCALAMSLSRPESMCCALQRWHPSVTRKPGWTELPAACSRRNMTRPNWAVAPRWTRQHVSQRTRPGRSGHRTI